MSAPGPLELSPEARWRNYQHLIWSQQQIHMQIQQQNQQLPIQIDNGSSSGNEEQTSRTPTLENMLSGDNNEKQVEEKPKELLDMWENFDVHAAFLGPTLWDKRLPYDGQEFKLEYVDLEEFLTENGIPVEGEHGNSGGGGNLQQLSPSVGMQMGGHYNPTCPPPFVNRHPYMAGPSRSSSSAMPIIPHPLMQIPPSHSHSSRSPSPSESSASSSTISSENSSPLISSESGHPPGFFGVPGSEFDPMTRSFTEDELKPQPMIKKSKKQFVPDEAKDIKYWARRRKNNVAAKRSRDARRVKENQIAMRAGFLEKENMKLRQEIDRIQKENSMLQDQLSVCRRDH